MLLSDLLRPENVVLDVTARSKKNLLELASQLLAQGRGGLSQRAVFAALCNRERLGSTGLGHGVAIPHGRLSQADDVRIALLRLREPVAFDAPDDQPVDLIVAMAVPQNHDNEHVELLGQLAALLADDQHRKQLRSITGPNRLIATIAAWQMQGSAA